jgi:ferredoxin
MHTRQQFHAALKAEAHLISCQRKCSICATSCPVIAVRQASLREVMYAR